MATLNFLVQQVSDLCLGKPPLKSLPITATIREALLALKNSGDNFISVWRCDHTPINSNNNHDNEPHGCEYRCECVGKVCMVDVICYLCKDENLLSPAVALNSPVSLILPKVHGVVRHVDPSSSLVEAIDLMLKGAQNLVVPIKTRLSSIKRKQQQQKQLSSVITVHNGQEFCWLTQEDLIRFLLNSIGLFTPLPALSIDKLGIINSDTTSIDYHAPASMAIQAILTCLRNQTSVAVTDSDGVLIGELSPLALACCDESVVAAITTLSAGDLMAYIDGGGPPDDLMRMVVSRLKQKGYDSLLQEFGNSSTLCVSNSSSDEEFGGSTKPGAALRRQGKYARSMSYSARIVRGAEAIVCHPKSSLVAVMIQAIAHRVNYVWVIEDDCSLVGIVTFVNMLMTFREQLECML